MQKVFQWFSRNEIDSQKWDEAVADSLSGKIYQLSFYLDLVSDNWEALIYGDYEIVIPVAFKKYPGVKFSYQPFFCRQFGFISKIHPAPEQISSAFNLMKERYQQIHWCTDKTDEKKIPDGFAIEEWHYQQLLLTKEMRFSTNAVRLIRKAQKLYSVSTTESPEECISLFRNGKGREIKELGEPDYLRLNNLMKSGIAKKYGKIFVVKNGGEMVAFGYFWYFNNTVTYLKGTASEAGKKNGAMYLLFDEVIRQSKGDYQVFDFGGSRVKSVAEFYHKFGSEDQYYLSLKSGKLPLAFRLLKKTKAALGK